MFQGEPLELIRGQRVVAEPQDSYHASAITKVGWRYRSVTWLAPPAAVAPLAFSDARIAVADLLPSRSRCPYSRFASVRDERYRQCSGRMPGRSVIPSWSAIHRSA